MWIEIPLPKTISTDLIPPPETAYRMKNVYWNGRCLAQIEPLRYRGEFEVSPYFSPPLTYDTNLPLETTAFELGGDVVFVICAKSALYYLAGSVNVLEQTTPNANNWAGIEEIPPIVGSVNKTILFFNNWNQSSFRVLVANLQDGIFMRNMFLPTPDTPPVVLSVSDALIPNEQYVEYRYAYAFADTYFGTESRLSPPAVVLAPASFDQTAGNWVYTVNSFPAGVDMIRVYRATSKLPSYVMIAELQNAIHVNDNNPADYISPVTPKENNIPPPINTISDAEWVMDRLFVAENNTVYYSDVQGYGFGYGIPYGGDNPLLGGFFRLSEPIERLISWGSYCLVFTKRNVYRAVENEGVVVPVEFAVPTPLNKTTVKKKRNMVYIFGEDGLYVLTPNENVLVFNVDWNNLLEQYGLSSKDIWVRHRRFYDKEYVDIEFMRYVPFNKEFGFGYFRIDSEGNVSGMHTIDTWLG